MTTKIDAPVLFYLDHKLQIDEWHHLKGRAQLAVHEFFSSLAVELEKLAPNLDGTPSVVPLLENSWPKVLLARKSWLDSSTERPSIAIGIEWPRRTFFDGSYTGVWLDQEGTSKDALDSLLRPRLTELATSGEFKSSKWWPLWRYEQPSRKDCWHDLAGFRDELLDRLASLWTRLAPLVDQAFTNEQE